MEFKDYYAILGLKPDASAEDIKRAYRSLARKHHPDLSRQADAEERFKEVSEAYEALRDPEKRAAYDEAARRWRSGPRPAGGDYSPPPGWDTGFEFSGGFGDDEPGARSAYSSFFESLFGRASAGGMGSRRARRHTQGEDHHAKILIDLIDAYRGATRSITLRSPVVDASGRAVLVDRVLDVHIPRGIRSGRKLRLKGQGAADAMGMGPAGDLYLEVQFKPHPYFKVEGADVTLDLPVAPWEAALGAKISVPAPDRVVELTIPPHSGQGRKLRLKGLGIPPAHATDAAGDFYAVLQVALPPAHTEEAKALYRTMQQALKFNPRAALGV